MCVRTQQEWIYSFLLNVFGTFIKLRRTTRKPDKSISDIFGGALERWALRTVVFYKMIKRAIRKRMRKLSNIRSLFFIKSSDENMRTIFNVSSPSPPLTFSARVNKRTEQ